MGFRSFYCISKKKNQKKKNRPGQTLGETNFFAQEKTRPCKMGAHNVLEYANNIPIIE